MARRRATVPSLFSDVVCISLSHDAVILATGAAAHGCLRLQAARAAYFIISAGSRGFAAEAVGTTLPSICSPASSSRLISREGPDARPLHHVRLPDGIHERVEGRLHGSAEERGRSR